MSEKEIIEVLHLYEKRDELKKELSEIQKKIRKLRNSGIQPWVLKIYLKIYKKFGFRWIEYQKVARLFKPNPRKVAVYFQYLRKAGLIRRKVDKKDRRKSIYCLKKIKFIW